jgi:hypothetical protein
MKAHIILTIAVGIVACSHALFLTPKTTLSRASCKAEMNKRLGHHRSTALLASANKASSQKGDVVTIGSNYNVALGSALLTALGAANQNWVATVIFGLLTALFFIQTGRVRFTFDDEAMEVFVLKKDDASGETINASRENFAVGGKNRWNYDKWNDWSFIPSSKFPILFYFNENQTNGPEKGQLHLFPCILDAKQLEEMVTQKVGVLSKSK